MGTLYEEITMVLTDGKAKPKELAKATKSSINSGFKASILFKTVEVT